jgi:poly [ADP-ribose] polymerase
MGKIVELVCVTANLKFGNNKIYRMTENGNGTWTAEWGRVGSTLSSKIYPMSEWDKKYREKTQRTGKERYQDITSLKTTVVSKGFKDLNDKEIQNLLNTLQKYSKQSIIENYTVTAADVTPAQVNRAQEILNSIVTLLTPKTFNKYAIDKYLTELYIVLPRKMKNVKDHILNGDGDLNKAKQIFTHEQDLVDNMASQVQMNVQETIGEQKTLEEALGIKIEHVTPDEITKIKKLLGANVHQFRKAYKVTNLNTQKTYEERIKKSFKKFKRLLFHGSRNENWLSIIKNGLMIRPSNAVYTGSMFGDAVYFANKAQKSIGYTSLSGSYWARGSANQAFLALYEVNTGMEYRTQTREAWMANCTLKTLHQKGEYDSLFCKGGYDLRNDEHMIYDASQCTIKYLVEIGK